jgi:hypothetical protein
MRWESPVTGQPGLQLVQSGIISRLQFVEAFALAQATGAPVERMLVERGYATAQQLEQASSEMWRLVQLA